VITLLKDTFDGNIDDCLKELDNTLIEIYDCYDCSPEQQRSYIKEDKAQPIHFTLENPNAENITFVALDNYILKAHHQSRCDFIIGNIRKLYFVEIKQVSRGQRRQARTNATQQLSASLEFLSGVIDLTNTDLIAVICLKAKQIHPLQNAQRVADIVSFRERYNAELKEGQQDTF